MTDCVYTLIPHAASIPLCDIYTIAWIISRLLTYMLYRFYYGRVRLPPLPALDTPPPLPPHDEPPRRAPPYEAYFCRRPCFVLIGRGWDAGVGTHRGETRLSGRVGKTAKKHKPHRTVPRVSIAYQDVRFKVLADACGFINDINSAYYNQQIILPSTRYSCRDLS